MQETGRTTSPAMTGMMTPRSEAESGLETKYGGPGSIPGHAPGHAHPYNMLLPLPTKTEVSSATSGIRFYSFPCKKCCNQFNSVNTQ